ncbi:MAG: hypothetical protein NWF01_07445 [Candidatus Bathyarchaeota archaeon]|nr:hypothetical protein [Candidatus Bathyarchaeota archaeon]
MEPYCKNLLSDFLKNSWSSIEALVETLHDFKEQKSRRQVQLFRYKNGKKVTVPFDGNHFFLRSSVEYSNPQLTIEELQGIVGTRLLEACADHFFKTGIHPPTKDDFNQLCEILSKPPQGFIVPFLLNTDDVEANRYSSNPLKRSITESGQSAYPAAYVRTDQLKIDSEFTKKYQGKLISQKEIELINSKLDCCGGSYLDFVESVKYARLDELSRCSGFDLSLYSLRMPLSTLQSEGKDGLIHYIISQSHHNYDAVNEAYACMGRSMKNRTTLLTIPHSSKGYGSKRAARGRLYFDDGKLSNVNVTYKATALYPTGVDKPDVAVAECQDSFTVAGEKLADYSFEETPSSPQFFLYSMASPEDGAVWHGVGKFGASKLLQSYSAARVACKAGRFIGGLDERFGVRLEVPLQFNLEPQAMWSHPVYHNIDAGVGTVASLADLVQKGMTLEHLAHFEQQPAEQ